MMMMNLGQEYSSRIRANGLSVPLGSIEQIHLQHDKLASGRASCACQDGKN